MAWRPLRARGWFLAAALLFGLQGSVACNSVLGIEQAEPSQALDSSLTCDWPEGNPQTDCSSCDEGCVKQCGIAECLGDQDCRNSLFQLLKCVGSTCVDSGAKCGGCVQTNDKARTAAQCLRGCGGGCDLFGAISLCEGYCACMHDRCSKTEPNGTGTGGCMQACLNGLPPGATLNVRDPAAPAIWSKAPEAWQIGCFWYHCESALQPNDGFHCDHAVGDGAASVCPKPAPPDPHATLCAYPKGYGNAPCNRNSDCCSGTCLNDIGVCTSPGNAH